MTEPMPGGLFAQGRTAKLYTYGSNRVLKVFRKQFPHFFAEQEFRASRFAWAAGLPVPKAVELMEWGGNPAISYERIPGGSLLQRLMARPWQAGKLGSRMAELQTAVNRIEAGPGSELPSLREVLKARIQTAPLITEAEKQAILLRLAQLPDGGQLCHGDFHPGNVLVKADGEVIIDWMTAAAGHPAADAARTALLLRTAVVPDNYSRLAALLIGAIRSVLLRRYTQTYLRLSGLTAEDLEPWLLPLAAARLHEDPSPEEKLALVKLVQRLIDESHGKNRQ